MVARDSDGCAGRIVIVLVFVLGIVAVGYFRGRNNNGLPAAQEAPSGEWNKGGTLHNKSALDWQVASREDKIATCGEFVTTMWKNGSLADTAASQMTELNDAWPFVQEIVSELDSAFEPRSDPAENQRTFAGQPVSEAVMSVMFRKGWLVQEE